MAETQEPRNDLYYNYDPGVGNWGDNVSTNFLQIGLRMHMSVINQTTTDPSLLTPTLGDAYIIGAGATGDWSSLDGQIAVYAIPTGGSAQWIYIVPYSGFLAFDQSDNTLYAHNGTNWSTNGFTFTFI
jgi:hypothetical protein